MRKFSRVVLLALAVLLIFPPYFSLAEEDQEKAAAFSKRYLTVTPPRDWKIEQGSVGGLVDDNCISYVQEDSRLGVFACPGFGREHNFADTRADFMQDEQFTRHGRCLIGKDEELAILLVPLKDDREDKQGAIFIVMNEESMEESVMEGGSAEEGDILQKAGPLLRLFTHFDWPRGLLEGKM